MNGFATGVTEEELRRLLEEAPVALCVADAHGRVRAANAAWSRLTGLSPEAALAATLDALVTPADGGPVPATDRARAGERVRVVARRPAGPAWEATLAPVVLAAGPVLVLAAHPAAPAAAGAPFEAIAMHAPAGIALFDGRTMRVRWANPAFLELLDEPWRTRGVAGLGVEAFLPLRADAWRERLGLVISAGVPATHIDAAYRGADQGMVHWRSALVPLPRPDGGYDAIALTVDVTDPIRARRRAEALAALASDLNRGHRVEHVLATGVQRARGLLGGDAAIWLEDGPALHDALGHGEPLAAADFPALAEALATGRALLLGRTAASGPERAWLDRHGALAAFVAPLVANERALGVLVSFLAAEAAPPAEDVALAGAVAAQIALAVAKTRALEQERVNAARVALLQTATAAFSAAHSTGDVARALFDHAATPVAADFATLVLLRAPGRLETVADRGLSDAERGYFHSFHVEAPFPTAAAVRTRAPLWLDRPEDMDLQFPELGRARRGAGHVAWAALPLVVRGEAIGGVGLAWKTAHRFGAEERQFLLAVVDQCAQAIDRARLFEAERRARARLALSSEVTAALATTRTRAEVVTAIFAAGLGAFGASAVAWWERESDARLRLTGCEGYPPEACAPWKTIALDAPSPFAEADRTGAPVWVEAREALLERFGSGVAPARVGALAAVPLAAAGRVHGVLGLLFDAPHAFDEEERRFVTFLGGKLAEALERAWFFESERLARERAEAAEAEARRIGELQERLMAVVGHDLRTPLSAIALASRVLFHRGLSEDQAQTVSRIASSAARMAAIVRDLLDFGRIRSGQGIALERKPVDAARVCERAIRELEDLHPGRAIALEVAGDTVVEADPDRLAQVVSNLVGNALHHAGPDASVTVRAEGDPGAVRLLVRDDGRGVPEDLLETMFEPFRRGDERGGSHLGLGLFIVREIVRAHGGDVVVRSAPDAGTEFTVTLPREGGGGRRRTTA